MRCGWQHHFELETPARFVEGERCLQGLLDLKNRVAQVWEEMNALGHNSFI